ncbi:MAG: hypothetical protein ACXV5H_04775 [Halobacteriota archaeon]
MDEETVSHHTDLLRKTQYYDEVKDGHAFFDNVRYEWLLKYDGNNECVLITYKAGNGEWIRDSYLDEAPPKLLAYIVTKARQVLKQDTKKIDHSDEQEKRDETSARDKEAQAHAYTHALQIHQRGNPPEFIINVFRTLHVGDAEAALGALVGTANQSVLNSKGIQPATHGESGKGKSHVYRCLYHLHPPEYVRQETFSDNALFYMADELKPGMTIFSDDARISEAFEGTIKRATTNFQGETSRRVTIKDGNTWRTKILTIPPRINWALTSVDSQGSEQLVNRQASFGVDESASQDSKVVEFELKKAVEAADDLPLAEDVYVCREIIRMIKEDDNGNPRLFKVKIPFALRIEWSDTHNRRNLPIFLDMIKGFAVLHFMQRKCIDGCLIATEADFNEAKALYNTRAGLQKLHVTERGKEMLQHIEHAGGELRTDELMERMELSRSRVRQIAERLETTLPEFHREKRSESASDYSDADKRTTTQHVYYCYSGHIDLGMFSSIVSLRDATDEEREKEWAALTAGKQQLHPTCTLSDKYMNEAQNNDLNQNNDHNTTPISTATTLTPHNHDMSEEDDGEISASA